MRWHRILLSRFFIVPAVLIAGVAAWNLYVNQHAHGLLEGSVVDATGKPVPGATVILSVHDFVTQVEKARAKTDSKGNFRFTDNNSHLIQLQAQDHGATSSRITIRLLCRAQDREVKEPLRLQPGA